MILIADSGSTGTSWRLITKSGAILQDQSDGINPYLLSGSRIKEIISNVFQNINSEEVIEVFYYGAGCTAENNRMAVSEAISTRFANAKIKVESDMLGAARSVCGRERGIVAILGTGSNSCYYDGVEIHTEIPSLGLWLGDEGSGGYIGKQILRDYFLKELPEHLYSKFKTRYNPELNKVLDQVYKEPAPSKFLGSFTKFVFDNLKEPYCQALVYTSFTSFVTRYLKKYSMCEVVPIHFCGSVAFYFNSILRKAAIDQNLAVGMIVEDPIAGLTLYHKDQ